MIKRILEGLLRQKQGMRVLKKLLEEEFSHLVGGEPQAVAGVEFSIQELSRQLTMERVSLARLVAEMFPGKTRVSEIASSFPPEIESAIRKSVVDIDKLEQECCVQASKSFQMAQAMAEQTRQLLEFVQKRVTPRHANVYSARGRYAAPAKVEASFVNRRQ